MVPDGLAAALQNHLQIVEITPWGLCLFVSGILDIDVKSHVAACFCQVPVCIIVPPDPLKQIPLLYVTSRPQWLKSGEDWHVSQNGLVCMDWEARYVDHLNLLSERTEADLADVAAQWITRSAAHILHVHITCHATGRTKWPKGVPYWDHGDAAAPQYKLEKQAILRALKPNR